jgi:hypothetical protein
MVMHPVMEISFPYQEHKFAEASKKYFFWPKSPNL